jgi:cytoskeletal protein CcmA (bactofilin family)
MALFRKSASVKKEKYFSCATIVTQGTHCVGSIIGDDSIQIEGEVRGDVQVNSVVIIGKSARVIGNIKAQQVISSGETEGEIICDALELLEHARTVGKIKANKILIKGRYQGEIVTGGLFIHNHAKLNCSIQAKSVVVGGDIEGTIICRELKITPTGRIKGKTFAERIINQGGHVEGFIGRYSELVQNNPQLLRYAHIFNTPDTILLGYNDYHVDVKEEIEKRSQDANEDNNDSDNVIITGFE